MSKEKDAEHKILMVGPGGVGKSAITLLYIYDEFVDDYEPTKADSYRKQMELNGVQHTINILDTAGQEDYASVRDQYFRSGEGFVFVFSLTEMDSFKALKDLHDQVLRIKEGQYTSMILVGNKSDLTRNVSEDLGRELANSWGCPYIETSAKLNKNIKECFQMIVRDIYQNKNKGTTETSVKIKKKKKTKCDII